jgi:hypothetical protein
MKPSIAIKRLLPLGLKPMPQPKMAYQIAWPHTGARGTNPVAPNNVILPAQKNKLNHCKNTNNK